ncbi:hypothetical protein XaC1_512 [Xanthomonas phage XaC1]|nr:hypothetical protein XaC1_512 [Xanthomonas phage XaC1]
MSTKVTLHVSDEDMEYAHSPWTSAESALQAVNKVLKERGIDIEFEVLNYGCAEDVPDEFFGEDDEWIEVKEE